MLLFFSIAGLLASFALGYTFKQRYAWFLLMTMPILGPGRLVLVPSTLAPLDFYQVTILGILGILIGRKQLYKGLVFLLKDNLFITIAIFTVYRLLISELNRYPYLLFSWVPQMLIGFLLAYIIVHDKNDIERILRIYSIQGAFIGLFIVIGYYTDFSLEEMFRSTIPGYDIERVYAFVRSYNVRVNGLDGSAVLTAARLSVLISIALYYYFYSRDKFGILYLLLVIMGLVLLQTRAAFVSIPISGMFMLMHFPKFPIRLLKRMTARTIPLIALVVASLSSIIIVVRGFMPYLVRSLFEPLQSSSVMVKVDRIPIALQYFRSRPFAGYGSPHYVYYEIMNTADLPAPLIYLLAGGIFMFTLYMTFLFYMPYKTYQFYRKKGDISLLFISVALLSGAIMPMSNWIETHFVIMLILYTAVKIVYSKT